MNKRASFNILINIKIACQEGFVNQWAKRRSLRSKGGLKLFIGASFLFISVLFFNNKAFSQGYTTPLDANSNGIYDFQEAGSVPIITNQPTDEIVCEDDNTGFTVSATGTQLSYQWQLSINNGVIFSPITSAGTDPVYTGYTSNSLSLKSTDITNNGYYYRIIVYSDAYACDSTISNVVDLTVNVAPTAPAAISPQVFCTSGSYTVADLIATGTDLNWYKTPTGGTALLLTDNISNGNYYVDQTLSSCASVRTIVDVQISDTTDPLTPTLADIIGQCTGTAAAPTTTDNCAGTITGTTSDALTYSTQGTHVIAWDFNDGNGNVITVNQNVILINTTDPVTTCPADITVGFDLNCQYTLLDYTAGASAIDNCSASPAITFTQSPVSGKVVTGSTVITITAEDEAGNTGTCTFNIIASDSIDPVTPTLTDITGQCSATATAPTTTDNCAGTVTGTTSDALTYTTQGTHVIAWLFDDGNGNSITVNQNVIISDVTVPMAICQDTTLVMDFITNDVTIDPTYINNGSFDQCGISSINLSASVFGPVGIYTTILLLEDVNGNNSSCTAQVNVIDAPDPPIAVCQDITLNLLADGTVSIPDSAIDGGSFDNTEIADMIASQLDFTCSDLGNNLVTLHVEDDEGNLGQCGATVTIIDDISPTLNCQNATVYLDSNGISLISYLDLVTSFNDNCGVFSIQLSQGDFDGTHLHSYNVIVEITDGSGNMNSCLSIVTVLDTIAPMLICTDLVIPLNASGFATVTSNQVGVGSSDNNLNLISFISDNINFDCTDIGDTLYSVIAVDPSGNSSTCDAIVTVVDNIAPTVLCQNFVLDLDDLNQGSITIADINNDNFDNCGIDSLSLSQYDFDENDLGINNVVLTAVDVNGNTRSCTATVRVNSTIPPDAVCQDISISLNVDGDVSIIAADVDGGSTDPNGQVSLTITQEEFTCANIGDNIVIMSAENTFGITTTCMATVSVVDDITPVLTCPTDKILPNDLEQCGAIVNYGPVSSEDNCAVSLELINGALNNTFFDVGITSIEYRATDLSGNETFCSFNVEVTDSETPRISCSVDIYSIDEIVTYDSPTFDDNCTAELVQIEGATTGSEFDHGFNEQTYLATDGAGLSAECSFTVTVNSDVVAVNDSVVSMEGVSIEIDALFNDFDPDGDDFSIVSANSSLGDVMIVEGKTLVYIPEIDWCGTDSIYYEIEDVFGSRSFATVYLEVSCDVQVFIPEGFSPNNDSVNDYFEIVGIENYPQAELNIYNRWSHIVYESKDYDNSWDGTMTNPLTLGKKIIPMGTYFYNLKIDDTITFKGYFYISR